MQNENCDLQQQIQEILEENRNINSKLEILKNATQTATDSKDDATREKFNHENFINVKKQIDYLQAENKDLRALHRNCQQTIENLKHEIQNYRNQLFKPTSVCEIKQKYTTAIKILENSIINQKCELKEQATMIENLLEQKKMLRDHVEKLEKSIQIKETEIKKIPLSTETIKKLQEQLDETIKHNKELQKSLKLSKITVEERFKREQSALQKVQEALAIAEAAVADKDEVLKREKVLKEECDNIASTIGQVMDEAARKVEQDMDSIKKKFSDKEKILFEEKEKMEEEIQRQKKFNQILDTRCNRFEQKYKDAIKDNDRLSQQLELAAKTLYEMEQRLNNSDNYLKKEDPQNEKPIENQEKELRQYIYTNKQLKEKYRIILNQISKDFKQEIYRLQSEVATLKAENQLIKSHQRYHEEDLGLNNQNNK